MTHMNKQHVSAVALAVLAGVVLMLGASATNAETIGYWRFEGATTGSPAPWLTDSSGNGLTLAMNSDPTQCGSGFDNPVPKTGSSNDYAADLDGNDFFSRAETAADEFKLKDGDFTVEAYIRRETDHSAAIASQGSIYSPSGERSWAFYARRNDQTKDLFLFVSDDGTNLCTINSGVVVPNDTDCFVAASFDLSDKSAGAKFYLKNLVTGVWTTSSRGHTIDSLYNSSGDFRIGTDDPTANGAEWVGLLDEVRLSDTVLGQNQLLAVPEPSTLVLLGTALLGLLLLLRRRRK